MAYSDFRNLSAVLQEFQVRYEEVNFVAPIPFPIANYFRDDLSLMLREGVVVDTPRPKGARILPSMTRLAAQNLSLEQ